MAELLPVVALQVQTLFVGLLSSLLYGVVIDSLYALILPHALVDLCFGQWF
ncbi:MAG: hypothetical protein V8T37_04240 [Streptococcus sp.]